MRKNHKKNYKKMDLLKGFKFVVIHIIPKILALLKNHLNFFIDNIFECFFKKYNRLLFFKKINFFFKKYNDGKFKS